MQLQKHMKVTAGCAGAAVFGIMFGWLIFPKVLKSQIKKEMALSSKTDVRQMWTKVPFALDFKLYIFNYTNPDEIMKGEPPIVNEIGPYYFEEWKEKVDMEDHEDTDTITYKRLDTFYFKKSKSAPGLTGEEVLTVPNIMLVAIPQVVEIEKPTMLNVAAKAIKAIWKDPKDVFMRVKAMDLLFRGVPIDCNHKDFAPKAVCTAVKKESSSLMIKPDNQYEFSLFGMRNGTPDKTVVTVKRGIKNVMDVGQVAALDGETEMNIWRDTCNQFVGTDGTIFPPFLTPSDRLESFAIDLCRPFKPWYEKKTSYSSIKTNRYVANIGDFAKDPELNCFCNAPDQCAGKGLMDMYKCMKAPLFASLPHFLDCEPELAAGVKGLNPNVEQHGIYIDFEPLSGTPMEARQRIQFNIKLKKVDKIDLFTNFKDTMVPLFWLEEGLALNKTFVKMLNSQLFIPLRVVNILKWLMVSVGTVGAIAGTVYHFKGPRDRGHVMKFAVNDSAKTQQVQPDNTKPVSIIGQHIPLGDQEPAKISI